jgi:hypothetical protein|tara:strand:- start:294 stop:563 length:270 start_codon:yes stop_codon:yes gene_type:complete
MGKKKSRASQTSSGERRSVNKKLINALRRDYLTNEQLKRLNNQHKAFTKGKNVVLTIPNPNDKETAKRFIKVNARDLWKQGKFIMKQNG